MMTKEYRDRIRAAILTLQERGEPTNCEYMNGLLDHADEMDAALAKQGRELSAALKLCCEGSESLKRTIKELNDDWGETIRELKAERELGDALADALHREKIGRGVDSDAVLARHAEMRRKA